MLKQYQTRIDSKYGNCLQSSVACIFDLPIDEVPAFMEDGTEGGTWYEKWWEWLDKRGYALNNRVWNGMVADGDFKDDEFYVVQGKSPRGEYDHCVVYKGMKPEWDVHPSGLFLDGEPKYVYTMRPKRD